MDENEYQMCETAAMNAVHEIESIIMMTAPTGTEQQVVSKYTEYLQQMINILISKRN